MLDVAGDDLDTQIIHIYLCLLLYLITKGLSVIAKFLKCDGTDDLTHVTLKRIYELGIDLLTSHIEEVLHSELDALFVGPDLNLGNSVDVNADEVCCRNEVTRLDVDRDLLDEQLVFSLKERELQTGFTDQNLRLSLETRNDVCLVRRSLHIARCDNDDKQDNCNYDQDRGYKKCCLNSGRHNRTNQNLHSLSPIPYSLLFFLSHMFSRGTLKLS